MRNLILIIFFSFFLHSQSNEECLGCHGERGFSVQRGIKQINLYVEINAIKNSVHAELECINCHSELANTDYPHKAPLSPVKCGECHPKEEKEHSESLHGRALKKGDPLAPNCKNCHNFHNILSSKDLKSDTSPLKIPYLCGKCHREGSPVQLQREIHQDRIIENYTESIHGEGLLKKGLIVSANCTSCHTAHHILPHTDERSSIARKNIAKTCAKCHAEIELVHQKIIKGELWEKEAHILPACIDCHQSHKIRKVFYELGLSDKTCLKCHLNPDLKSLDGRSMFIEISEIQSSAHSKIACAQCHTEVSAIHKRPCEAIKEKVKCANCHEKIGDEFYKSRHGQLLLAKDPNAPDCSECHSTHKILKRKDPSSPTFAINIPTLCAKCHREGEKAAVRYKGEEREIVNHYIESIHGKGLLKSGLTVTATCVDCHTPHSELQIKDPNSTVNPQNLPKTCGKCHHGIYQQFINSIHSTSKKGKELPTCKDCHAAHTIKRADQDIFRFEIMDKCGRCHQEIAKTYFETFHGKVSKLGYAKSAKCYDCHGAHDILHISDPRSHLSRQNVVSTCQKCHPGANRRFAGYLTHATHHDPKKYPYLFYSFWFMTILLVGTLSFFGLHTILWFFKGFRSKEKYKKENERVRYMIRRFTKLESYLHILMIISFLSLSVTGLSLKFSYTEWAQFISKILGGFETTGLIHRTAAILMFFVFFTHVYDLITNKRKEYKGFKNLLFGRNTMIFTLKDVKEFFQTILWFLGKKQKPEYSKWTYWEKFDYFAVFWGIAIIGSTGLMLWFSEFFTKLLPGWLINVATIVHSDEALLATGFIFTIHFFNTHLRPEKFPMDTVIFTGGLTEEELKFDKPKEYEFLVKNNLLDQYKMGLLPSYKLKLAKYFGFTALSIGFFIIIWIIYAMIFAYK